MGVQGMVVYRVGREGGAISKSGLRAGVGL